jgi:hypothetical protein
MKDENRVANNIAYFSDSECSDHGSNRNTAIVYPGWSDLTQVGWNDAIGSFSCEYWVSGGK